MKRTSVILILLATLTMSGCLVSSIHPFYKNKDKIFDEKMIGSWVDKDSCIWEISRNSFTESLGSGDVFDTTYYIRYHEEGKIAYLQGTLFELNGQRYVDFFPEPDEEHFDVDMAAFHHVPVHTLARVRFKKDTLMLFWFGEEWLNDLFENNRIRIDHEKVKFSTHYESNVLTAETDDLQKFIVKYMNDKKNTEEIENAFAKNQDSDNHVFLKLFPHNTGSAGK